MSCSEIIHSMINIFYWSPLVIDIQLANSKSTSECLNHSFSFLLFSALCDPDKCVCEHVYSVFINLSLSCEHSFTNMYSPLWHGHYHIHLVRRYPLLLFCPSTDPSMSPHTTLGVYVFIFFVSERLFWLQCPIEGWSKDTLELPQKHIWTGFDLSDCISTFMHLLHACIHTAFTIYS